MSRESILVNVLNGVYQPVIFHYECFGWELLQLHNNVLVFSRETQDSVYPELVNFEREYNNLESQKKAMVYPTEPQKPAPLNLVLCIILFVLFIIPGVLYLLKCNKEKKQYEENYNRYQNEVYEFNERTRDLTMKMESLEAQSRALFFSKRSETEIMPTISE